MAWSFIGKAFWNGKTAAGTKVDAGLQAALSAVAGNVVVAVVAKDNTSTTNGSTTEVVSVTDSAGNTYTKVGEYTSAGGAASAGATVAVFTTVVTTALTAGSAMTATFTTSVNAAAMVGAIFAIGAGHTVSTLTATAEAATTSAGSLAFSGLPNAEYLFLRGIAREGTNANIGVTTNYTDFGFAAFIDAGGSSSSMAALGEFRILTGTGDTSDPGTDTADTASLFIVLQEVSASTRRFFRALMGVGF